MGSHSPTRALVVVVAVVLGTAALAGCSSGDGDETAEVDVVAGFYPMAWVAERVGGERVSVTDLTPSGVEPHDLELAPPQVDDGSPSCSVDFSSLSRSRWCAAAPSRSER